MHMFKNHFHFISAFALILSVVGCSSHSKDLGTDVGAIEEGDRLAKDSFYDEARKQYLRVKTEFPSSSLQADADLKIADSYFKEESWQAGANAYDEYIKTYPGRPEIPFAILRLGLCYYNQMPSTPQRDTRSTSKVVDTFTRLMVDYPNSKEAAEAQNYTKKARAQLGDKIYEIGLFYRKMGDYESAARRFAELVDQYPDHSKAEEAFALEVETLRKAGKTEKANERAKAFQAKFPESKFNSYVKP